MPKPPMPTDLEIAHDLAIRDFRLMESWDDATPRPSSRRP